MNPLISVIIPTHNPNKNRLQRTLEGLKAQTLAKNNWELIVVDNATPDPTLIPSFDLAWHKSSKIIVESQLGLTKARIAGVLASRGIYQVFVDDDNVLEANYLENIIEIFRAYPKLGAIGGKSLPSFEIAPEEWVKDFWVCLALRDMGEQVKTYFYDPSANDRQYPPFAPIGAGMALQLEAAKLYINSIQSDSNRIAFDRTGKSLQSGGDCDINLTLLEAGWGVGYFPQLQLTHLISASRLTKEYLARLNYASSCYWIQVLDCHNFRPWQSIPKWSVLPRQIKSFFIYQAWKDCPSFIKWQGACGMFKGLARLT